MKTDFYVYAHLNAKNNSPFYIGKGRQNRAFDTGRRSNQWKAKIASLGDHFRVLIVQEGLSEEEALDMESRIIQKLGTERDGGILVNLDGSDFNPITHVAFSIDLSRFEVEFPDPHPSWKEMNDHEIAEYLTAFPYFDLSELLEQKRTVISSSLASQVLSEELEEEIDFILGNMEAEIENLRYSSNRSSLTDLIQWLQNDLLDLEALIDDFNDVDDIEAVQNTKTKLKDLLECCVSFLGS